MQPIQKNSRRNLFIAIGVVVVVAIIGLAFASSRAATSYISLEAEQGAVTSGSPKVVNDAAASAGKYLQFMAPATNGGVTGGDTTSVDLTDAKKKDIAMQLVSSSENSSLDWKAQYAYIEYNVEGNEAENRGYTGGIIGFCSRCSDMQALVNYYNQIKPNNALTSFIPALQKVNGTSSSAGLGTPFVTAWKTAGKDTAFQEAQDHERDRVYFNPAVTQAKTDGLKALGQFIYYDALVMHGPGTDSLSFGGIRAAALKKAKTPAQGGNETTYLNAFLDARKDAMLAEEGHSDTTRVDTMQRTFLQAANLNLDPPLSWSVYGDKYTIAK
jgi:chitosanase